MKRKLLILSVLAICLASIAMGSLAYFNAEDTAHNVITTGGVGIQIVETDENGEPFANVSGVMPGTEEYKIVTVTNTEQASVWLRVWVNVGISEDGDPLTDPTVKSLPLTIATANGAVNAVELVVKNADGGFDKLADNAAWGENWLLGDDGYYYYRHILAPGEATAHLFDAVQFAPEMGNEYQNSKIYIDISAEAVQSDNNGASVTDVAGWPEV